MIDLIVSALVPSQSLKVVVQSPIVVRGSLLYSASCHPWQGVCRRLLWQEACLCPPQRMQPPLTYSPYSPWATYMPCGILTVLAIGNVHAIFGVLNVLAFGNVHDFGNVHPVLGVLARLLSCTHCTQPWHICAADPCIARYGCRCILQTTT
jgi:hypothetical protein